MLSKRSSIQIPSYRNGEFKFFKVRFTFTYFMFKLWFSHLHTSNPNWNVTAWIWLGLFPSIFIDPILLPFCQTIMNEVWTEEKFNSDVKFTSMLVFSCPGSSVPDLGQWVSQCHFRISTQRVTFETWDSLDIWLEWCLHKNTKRRKKTRKKQKRQQQKKQKREKKQSKRKRLKYKKLIYEKMNKWNNVKTKRQIDKETTWEFNIVMSGQFCTLAMFFFKTIWDIQQAVGLMANHEDIRIHKQ